MKRMKAYVFPNTPQQKIKNSNKQLITKNKSSQMNKMARIPSMILQIMSFARF